MIIFVTQKNKTRGFCFVIVLVGVYIYGLLCGDGGKSWVNSERIPTKRATRASTEPRVNTLTVITVSTLGQNLHFIAIFKNTKTYAALTLFFFVILRRLFWPVQDNRQRVNRREIEAPGEGLLRAWHVGVGILVGETTTEPSRVEEEEADKQNDGEYYDDREERSAANLEVVVVQFRVVPVKGLRFLRCHWIGDSFCFLLLAVGYSCGGMVLWWVVRCGTGNTFTKAASVCKKSSLVIHSFITSKQNKWCGGAYKIRLDICSCKKDGSWLA